MGPTDPNTTWINNIREDIVVDHIYQMFTQCRHTLQEQLHFWCVNTMDLVKCWCFILLLICIRFINTKKVYTFKLNAYFAVKHKEMSLNFYTRISILDCTLLTKSKLKNCSFKRSPVWVLQSYIRMSRWLHTKMKRDCASVVFRLMGFILTQIHSDFMCIS